MGQTSTENLLFEKIRHVLRQAQVTAAPLPKPLDVQVSMARFFAPQILAGHEWCQPLNQPVWSTTAEHMNDDDPVLGIYGDQRAWALPWWIMKNHHVANLILHEQPLLVTLCEMCSGAAAFHACDQGQRYTFRLAGQYNGTILIADDQTNSVWSPFSGHCLAGVSKGVRLQRLPLIQCLWREWQTVQPATQVLYGEQTLRAGHGSEFSPGSPGIDEGFCQTLLQPLDERLPHNTLVLGVEGNGVDVAYPLAALDAVGYLLNVTLPAADLVILHQPGTLQALAFSRRIGDQLLAFEQTADGKIYDQNTGTRWNLMGEAIDGALAGHRLTYLPSGVEEWYVWAAYHPETTIYGFDQ